LRRVTSVTEPEFEWQEPVSVYSTYRLDAVIFTADAEFSAGTLIVERGDEITASASATLIDEGGAARNQRVVLEIEESDTILVDGDQRSITRLVRTPAAGDATIWSIRVRD